MPAPQPGRLVPDEQRAVLVIEALELPYTIEPQPGAVITKETPAPETGTVVLNAGQRLVVESTTATFPHVSTVTVGLVRDGKPITFRFKIAADLLKQIARPVMVPVGPTQGG